ncbi:hypothetical protein TSUD_334280 [Trifolium subterraneum]|uniref:tRNA (guanine-N(7)-)-methyltransferase non-catalytic subunit n=1 Tax=Trifolium subterraneum TaxID=3900 RepID=A0A2Z6MJ55_TRISU|nr:hypothetical protein TSUD_334280 [Trifolium subterraneum]
MDEEVTTESRKETEVAPALIAVHPTGHHIAVAVGPELRIFNLLNNSAVSLLDESISGENHFHKDNIRAIRFGAKGKLFVSAGDDKTLKIWSSETWHCIATVSSEKRVTAVAISKDGLHVCFADKFGLVWVVDLNQTSIDKKPKPLLSHYCSIITSLEFSPDNRFIISADRDFKIRVSNFPKNPLNGAHEIQSFCLGHTEFVSCLAFVPALESPHSLLLSGSGDSTVRLWDISSGALLDTCEVAVKAGLLESSGNAEEHGHAVTDLCATLDGLLVAVAIQRQVSCYGDTFVPTCLANSPPTRELWMVTGVSSLPGYDYPSLARVLVISGIDAEQEPVVLGDDKIPGGIKLLETLQGTAAVDDNAFLVAAEAVKAAMCNLLIKKNYPFENREYRKKTRNDRKLKE